MRKCGFMVEIVCGGSFDDAFKGTMLVMFSTLLLSLVTPPAKSSEVVEGRFAVESI